MTIEYRIINLKKNVNVSCEALFFIDISREELLAVPTFNDSIVAVSGHLLVFQDKLAHFRWEKESHLMSIIVSSCVFQFIVVVNKEGYE